MKSHWIRSLHFLKAETNPGGFWRSIKHYSFDPETKQETTTVWNNPKPSKREIVCNCIIYRNISYKADGIKEIAIKFDVYDVLSNEFSIDLHCTAKDFEFISETLRQFSKTIFSTSKNSLSDPNNFVITKNLIRFKPVDNANIKEITRYIAQLNQSLQIFDTQFFSDLLQRFKWLQQHLPKMKQPLHFGTWYTKDIKTENTMNLCELKAKDAKSSLIHFLKSQYKKKGIEVRVKNNNLDVGYENEIDMSEFKKLLVSGIDVNEQDENGLGPVHFAVAAALNEKILSLLLTYGANPFLRVTSSFQSTCPMTRYWVETNTKFTFKNRINPYRFNSALELTQELNDLTRANLIVAHESRLSKTGRVDVPYNIRMGLNADSSSLVTEFYYDKGIITTRLKKLNSISDDERKQVKEVFFKYFPISEEEFAQDFSGDNKLIELIYVQGKLIGLTLFEKLIVKDICVINALYSCQEKNYRFSSLMLLLNFRLIFAINLLVPDKKVAHFFSAVNYSSFALAKNFDLYFPKFQPNEAAAKIPVQDIVNQVYGPKVEVKQKEIGCYVEEEANFNDSFKSEKRNLDEEFFYQELMAGKADKGERSKAVLMFFYACQSIFESLQKTTHQTMQINFMHHLMEMSRYLQPFVEEYIDHTKPASHRITQFANSNILFWKGRLVYENPSVAVGKEMKGIRSAL